MELSDDVSCQWVRKHLLCGSHPEPLYGHTGSEQGPAGTVCCLQQGLALPGKKMKSAVQWFLAKSSIFLPLIDKFVEEKSSCFLNSYKLLASTAQCNFIVFMLYENLSCMFWAFCLVFPLDIPWLLCWLSMNYCCLITVSMALLVL